MIFRNAPFVGSFIQTSAPLALNFQTNGPDLNEDSGWHWTLPFLPNEESSSNGRPLPDNERELLEELEALTEEIEQAERLSAEPAGPLGRTLGIRTRTS